MIEIIDPTRYLQAAHWTNVISVKSRGVKGDNSTDDAAAIQAILSIVGKKTVIFPAGIYLGGSSLTLNADTTIVLMAGAFLLKTFDTPNTGLAVSFLRTSSTTFGSKVSNITIVGPGTIGAQDATKRGRIMTLYGDNIALRDFTIDTYSNSTALTAAGDHWRVDNLRILNPQAAITVGGIRMVGGRDFRATNCYVESGDDSIQFCPIAAGNLLGNQSIYDSSYVGCTGSSTSGRFAVITLQANVGTLTCEIKNVTLRGCSGQGGERALIIFNIDSSGVIDGVLVDDCDFTVVNTPPSGQEILINNNNVAPAIGGGVTNVVLRRVRLNNTTISKTCLTILGPGISFVKVEDFVAAAPAAGCMGIDIRNANDVTIINPRLKGASGANVIDVGSGSACDRFKLFGGDLSEIYDGQYGLRIANSEHPIVDGVNFVEKAGQITAGAVSIANTVNAMALNRWNITGLSTAAPLSDAGVGTQRMQNYGSLGVIPSNLKVSGIFFERNSVTIASAATLVLGVGNLFHVTGTNDITDIAQSNGETVELVFDDVLTVVDSGHLRLAGNFVTAAGSTLRLESDGTDWNEISRSVNG